VSDWSPSKNICGVTISFSQNSLLKKGCGNIQENLNFVLQSQEQAVLRKARPF
jgi:hypothetical protein